MNIIKRFFLGRFGATLVMQSGAVASGDIVGGDMVVVREVDARADSAVEKLTGAGFEWDGNEWTMPDYKTENYLFVNWHNRKFGRGGLASFESLRTVWMARATLGRLK